MSALSDRLRQHAREAIELADAVESLYAQIEYKDHLIRRLVDEIERQRADPALQQQLDSWERECDRYSERLPS